MPDVEQHGYRAYPLVDHVADKVCAVFERHGATEAPTTRCKDLVDLVAIALAASVQAESQMTALRSEAERRALRLPDRFAVPDRELWERGYAAEAERSLLPLARTLDEALAVVRPFLDPLLDGTAHGVWQPHDRRWTSRHGLALASDSEDPDRRKQRISVTRTDTNVVRGPRRTITR
jgi:hypothetical protein